MVLAWTLTSFFIISVLKEKHFKGQKKLKAEEKGMTELN